MKKRRKRRKESSGSLTTLFEIMFGGLAGAAVAAVWLVLKPVAVVDSPRRDTEELPVRHAIHYQPGKVGLVRESQVKLKEQAVLQQSESEVSLSEQEINRWLVTRYGAAPAREVMGTGVELRPEPPLVRMAGDEMQIGVVYSFSGYDGKKNLVLQTRGHFDRASTGGFEFVPTKAYLGSCPLPNGFVSRFVVNKLMSVFSVPEEFGRVWSGLRDVALTDNHLKLQFAGVAPAPEPKTQPAPARATPPAVEANLLVEGAAAKEQVSVPEMVVEATTGEETEALETTAEDVVAALHSVAPAMEASEAGPSAVEPASEAAPLEPNATVVPAEVQAAPAPTPLEEAVPSAPVESN